MWGEIEEKDIHGFSLSLENKIFSTDPQATSQRLPIDTELTCLLPSRSLAKENGFTVIGGDPVSLIPRAGHVFLNQVGLTGKKREKVVEPPAFEYVAWSLCAAIHPAPNDQSLPRQFLTPAITASTPCPPPYSTGKVQARSIPGSEASKM